MTKAKKTNAPKKLYVTIKEVENGYTVKVSHTRVDDDWGYNEKTNVFLTPNAVIEFIETLI